MRVPVDWEAFFLPSLHGPDVSSEVRSDLLPRGELALSDGRFVGHGAKNTSAATAI
jgi:hypothetical protein